MIGMLDNAKARWNKEISWLRRISGGSRLQKNRKQCPKTGISYSQTTLLDKVVQWRLWWFWTRGNNDYWQNSTQYTSCRIRRKKKQRQTQTTMERQCKGGHAINWTDIEMNNGLDKGRRTVDVINVTSKLRACARAHDISTSAHSIFLLAYNRHRSRILLLTRQVNARTAK